MPDILMVIIMNGTEFTNKYCINCVKLCVCKFNVLELPNFISIDRCNEYQNGDKK